MPARSCLRAPGAEGCGSTEPGSRRRALPLPPSIHDKRSRTPSATAAPPPSTILPLANGRQPGPIRSTRRPVPEKARPAPRRTPYNESRCTPNRKHTHRCPAATTGSCHRSGRASCFAPATARPPRPPLRFGDRARGVARHPDRSRHRQYPPSETELGRGSESRGSCLDHRRRGRSRLAARDHNCRRVSPPNSPAALTVQARRGPIPLAPVLWPGEDQRRLRPATSVEVLWPIDYERRRASVTRGESRLVHGRPDRGGRKARQVAFVPQLALFLPILTTAPFFGFVCGLLLGRFA